MFTATTLKVMGRSDIGPGDSFSIWFVRNWGFLLIGLSLIWALWTIWSERCHYDRFSKRHTVITGLLVLGGLAGFLFLTTIKAGSSLIQTVP